MAGALAGMNMATASEHGHKKDVNEYEAYMDGLNVQYHGKPLLTPTELNALVAERKDAERACKKAGAVPWRWDTHGHTSALAPQMNQLRGD